MFELWITTSPHGEVRRTVNSERLLTLFSDVARNNGVPYCPSAVKLDLSNLVICTISDFSLPSSTFSTV